MKKLVFVILTIFILVPLSGCTAIKDLWISLDPASEFSYEGWKTEKLLGFGTIQLPDDWLLSEIDGYYMIRKPGTTAGSYEVVLFQSKAYTAETDDVNPLGFEIHFSESISVNGLSNGPVYGKGKYSVNGIETTLWYIQIYSSPSPESLLFLAEESALDEDMVRKLAASVAQGKRNGQ